MGWFATKICNPAGLVILHIVQLLDSPICGQPMYPVPKLHRLQLFKQSDPSKVEPSPSETKFTHYSRFSSMCSANCSIDSLEIWVQIAYWPPPKIAAVGGFFGTSWHHNPSPVDSWNHGSGTHPILWLNVENASFWQDFDMKFLRISMFRHPISQNFGITSNVLIPWNWNSNSIESHQILHQFP